MLNFKSITIVVSEKTAVTHKRNLITGYLFIFKVRNLKMKLDAYIFMSNHIKFKD